VNIRLRRGAWYKVLKLEELKAILEVGGRPVKVATALLEIVKRPPPRWTVVTPSGAGAKKAPSSMSQRYAVCPSCGERAALPRKVPRMRCNGCKWEFEIAWDEAYLTGRPV
jgi:rubredoxin